MFRTNEDPFQEHVAAETTPVNITRQEIIHELRVNGEFFIQFFLAEELTFRVPHFHLDCWALMTHPTADRVANALPRGHAKTTLSKLATVWHFLFSPWRFMVYLSNTGPVAQEAVKDIINYMRSDNFIAVFGALDFEVERDNTGYYVFNLRYFDENGGYIEKKCILRSFGSGQQVRGINIDNTRPQLAIVDDLEDDDNTATPYLQKKLIKWFYGPFIKALAKRGNKIIFNGNMLTSGSILHSLVNNPRWHSRRYGCVLSNGQPLWPDMWTLEAIKDDFIEYQKNGIISQWFAEMMNVPIAEGSALIDSAHIPYADIIGPGQQEASFITVDPAISRKTWADDTAIVVHALKEGIWRIVEYVVGKYTPDQTFMIVCEMGLRWRTRVVGVEQAGYQEALQFLFKTLMVVHRQHFDIYEIPHKNRTKTERLTVWCSLLRKRVWALQYGDMAVTEQLLAYDPLKANNRDDLIDACSMGVTMVREYLIAIMTANEPEDDRYKALTNLQACPN